MRVWGALVIVMLAAVPAAALDPGRAPSQYAVDTWTSEDGLPSSAVQALAQTTDGYLWIGTQAGLTRFDGARFVTFDSANVPALSSDYIEFLLADREGGLWIATLHGLVRYRDGAFEPVALEAHDGERIESLYQDAAGRVWVGLDDPGVLHVLEEGRFVVFRDRDGTTAVNVDDVTERGERLCVAGHALWCLDDGVWTTLEDEYEGASGWSDPAILGDTDGSLWVHVRNLGLRILGGGSAGGGGARTIEIDDAARNSVAQDLRRDSHGVIWMLGLDDLSRFRDGMFERFPRAGKLPDGVLTDILEDHEGSLWVGTQNGLARIRDAQVVVFSVPEGLGARQAYAVFVDRDDRLWVSTPGQAVQRLGPDGWRRFGPDDGVTHDVLSIWQGPDGTVFVGTAGGAALRFTGDRFERLDVSAVVLAGATDDAGTQWFGTLGGVTRSTGPDHLEEVDLLRGQRVGAMLHASDGSVWVGSFEGAVARRDATGDTVFGKAEGLSGDPVLAFHEDPNGTIWAASYGGGLVRFEDDTPFRLTTDHGLPHTRIYTAIEDRFGWIWMTGVDGVFAAERVALERVADGLEERVDVLRVGKKDGMRSAECNGGYAPAAAIDGEGRLWFPTNDGVVRLDPRTYRRGGEPPLPVIERLMADGQPVPSSRPEIDLPIGKRNVNVEYTGISFLAPDEVRFRYRLREYDDAWTRAETRRLATFTQVPPGRYTFEVEAAIGDGAWSRATMLSLRVPPRFYETIPFYAAIAALVALALLALHRYRLQRALELERVRLRIARDLHDDLGANLSSISFQSEIAQRRLETDRERSAALLGQIGDAAREAADAITDIVWAVDPRRDDLGSLAARLRAVAGELFDPHGIAWSVHAPADADKQRLAPEARRHLYLILKEALHNAAKHAAAERVDVRISTDGNDVVVRVQDDGAGFEPPDASAFDSGELPAPASAESSAGAGTGEGTDGARPATRGGHGLRNMGHRARASGGTLEVTSAPGSGTTITVRIPKS